jgi:putative flippase GtrA
MTAPALLRRLPGSASAESIRRLLPGSADPMARVMWFAFTGISAGMFQIVFLAGWLQADDNHRLGNLVSFLAAAQVNFVMNQALTWNETLRNSDSPHLLRRWLRFHGAIAGTGVLNQVLFNVLVTWLPAMPSVVLSIALVGVCNFFLLNALVFGTRTRERRHVSPRPARMPRYLLDARAH